MKNYLPVLVFVVLLVTMQLRAQETYSVVWYNVENLFDTQNDSLKRDDEFTPEGPRAWNNYKYRKKLLHLSKTLIALGKWSAPDIIGMCEVENKEVLKDLIYFTPLKYHSYAIVHYESPDMRGIDVALLYRKDRLALLHSAKLPVQFNDSTSRPTRDILYVSLRLSTTDTLHLFLNHWPSMWGGELTTRPKRMQAARILRRHIDSLLSLNPQVALLSLGDYNCTPKSPEITEGLQAVALSSSHPVDSLIYSLQPQFPKEITGTHKFHNVWSHLDQIQASGSLLNGKKGIKCEKNYQVAAPDFMLIKDPDYGGVKPFRTYHGFTYQGGFADHLPLLLYVKTRQRP